MLHIINKSPLTSVTLDTCLNTATGGDILLIEDAVYAATRGNAAEARLRAAMGQFKFHVLMPDLDARGLGDRLIDGVSPVDYGGFVDLTSSNKSCQSWL
ncbi:sulfurtransferase complex subunit TusB [Sideroxydans lithotrophicus]|jgi:tRNA 2-thiouridine synthesizing protein B|uniref:Sulfur relay protein TusB/DsrH n=1 Tax=Sideroxydans lithotrophicus (strain ES-1) TaxID=580332 RepID=D5CSH9_SIDLE|nr:sulfurtransferase complex subunit TusB [Sideroxydans lithotrophicus]ADE11915.1 sulfur relay protein TusB/DsrH [Sideroxydans lithotrophicus ES-1]